MCPCHRAYALVPQGAIGHHAVELCVIAADATDLCMQGQCTAPATRDGQKVCLQPARVSVAVSQGHCANLAAPEHGVHPGVQVHLQAPRLCLCQQVWVNFVAQLGQSQHLQSSILGFKCGCPSRIVVGCQDHAMARGHPPTVQVAAHGTGQHHARPVVVAK